MLIMNTDEKIRRELINQFTQSIFDAAREENFFMDSGPALARAEEIRKQLSGAEYKVALKESIMQLLNEDLIARAVGFINTSEDFGALVNDPDVKKLAQKKFEEAASRQMEIAETIKNVFRL